MENMVADIVDSFPEKEDQARISHTVEQLRVRNSLILYNSIVEKCFLDCVQTFWRKSLGKREEICIRGCTEKFMKLFMLADDKNREKNKASVLSD